MEKNIKYRFVINGFQATLVHYCALEFNLHVLNWQSIGVASLFASIFGITSLFLGCRHFVFGYEKNITLQFIQFVGVYGALCLIHAIFLLIWTDLGGYNYKIGFLIATAFQMAITYLCNQDKVFRL